MSSASSDLTPSRIIDAGGPLSWRLLHETVTARQRDLIVEARSPKEGP
jgi:hypothetical protein